jgi:hypothetical protein
MAKHQFPEQAPTAVWRLCLTPEMLADFACILVAWTVAYLLRLGMARIYVVTLIPEVLFIVVCAASTVVFLKVRGQYHGYRIRFHREDARRILTVTLGVGFGFSAAARFLDIEIISRTAILLAPPLSAALMINWRLALDHFSSPINRPTRDALAQTHVRKVVVVVNLTGIDLSCIYTYFRNSEVDFDLVVYGVQSFQGDRPSRPTAMPSRIRFEQSIDQIYEAINHEPNVVIALPEAKILEWKGDSRYRAQPGHHFVTIESLVARSHDMVGNSGYL